LSILLFHEFHVEGSRYSACLAYQATASDRASLTNQVLAALEELCVKSTLPESGKSSQKFANLSLIDIFDLRINGLRVV